MNLFTKIKQSRKERKAGRSKGNTGESLVAERLKYEPAETSSSLATTKPDSVYAVPSIPTATPSTQRTICGPPCVTDDFKPWAQAYEILQKRDPALMSDLSQHLASLQDDSATTTDLSTSGSVKSIVERLLDNREKEQWRVSLMGKEVKIRQQAERLVKFLLWSDKLVKDALSTQPYAALAWSGVSLILPLLITGSAQNEAMLKGFNTISDAQLYGKICEETYLQPSNRQMYRKLMEPLAELYSHIIEYQARAICYLSRAQLSRAWQAIDGWNDWDGKAAMIENLTQKYSSYISPLEAAEIRRNRDNQLQKMQESQDILDEIRRGLIMGREETQKNYEDQKERDLLQILASDYEDNKNINPKRVPGTCDWFFKDERFTSWRNSDNSSLLWVSAAPGCGKSVLSRALIDEQKLSTNITTSTVCYFFFKDGDERRMTATSALCAILHQLFTHDPDSGLIEHALESHKNYGGSLAQNFSRLWQILEDCVNSPNAGGIICVLDALDECSESHREQLIGQLKEFYCKPHNLSKSHSTLKFLIISRPYDSLEAYFARFSDTTAYLRFDGDEKSAEIGNEINLVIDARVDDIAHNFNQHDRQRIANRLKSMENRTYLWLYLTFDIIEKSRSQYSRRSAVETLLSKLPSEVSEAYEKILDQSKDQALAKALFRIVLAAARPLTLDEANNALTLATQSRQFMPYADADLKSELWPREQFKTTVKNLCGLFVNVYDSKLYFIHQTAREFLIDNEHEGKWKGCLNMLESHGTMTLLCLEYLSYVGEQDPAEDIKAKLPLAQYSARYWMDHARSVETETNVQETILDFFLQRNQAYVIWRTLYDPKLPQHASYYRNMANPLYYASMAGLQHTVSLLLDNGADVNAEGGLFCSALQAASFNNHKDTVKLLLDMGADVNAQGGCYRDTLRAASYEGHKEIVRLLLDGGADFNMGSEEHGNALQVASLRGFGDIVQLLLDNGADVNAESGWYGCALQAACVRGEEEMIQLLLDKGANINAMSGSYGSALQAASARGDGKIAQLLLYKGANINAKGGDYGSALQGASAENHRDIVLLLLDSGADINAEGGLFGTAFQSACFRGHEDIARLLLNNGACFEGYEEVVQLLLDKDANVDTADNLSSLSVH